MATIEKAQHQPEHASAPQSGLDLLEDLKRPEWLLVRRIVASPHFVRSAFLTNFLLYVCDRKLRSRESEITEYQIGTHALGRPDNYHPGEDNIVRNYARLLRKRLEEYFEEDGKHEPIQIVIPRGQYVPLFEGRTSADRIQIEEVSTVEEQASETKTPEQPRPIRQILLISVLAVLVAAVSGWLIYRKVSVTTNGNAYEIFWSQIFNGKRKTFIVTGDSGLALLQNVTGQDIHLHEYVSGSLESHFHALFSSPQLNGTFNIGRFSNYTSTADVSIVVGLTRLSQAAANTTKVRNARDMRMDDLKGANLVLIGGPRANPWTELFEPSSNFRMKFPVDVSPGHPDVRSILNKHPQVGERQEYSNTSGDSPYETYTILSFLPSLDGLGWVLLLEGQNIAGTEAAGDFILNSEAMSPVLQKARRTDGSIGSFEVILETETVGGDAPKAHIVVERYSQAKP